MKVVLVSEKEWNRRVARVIIEMVMPYLKKHKLKAHQVKTLTPELIQKMVAIIDWGDEIVEVKPCEFL